MQNRGCDGINDLHDCAVISFDENAVRMICKECKEQIVVRLDERGVPERRQGAEILQRLILHPNDRLFDKYYSRHARQ